MNSMFNKKIKKENYVIMNKHGEYFTGLLFGEPLWSISFNEAKRFVEDTKHIILRRQFPELQIESIEI